MAGRTYTHADRVAALAALEANTGNVKRTSTDLGIPRGTLRRWLEQSAPVAHEVAQVAQDVIATRRVEVEALADQELAVRRQYLASAEAVVREAGRIAFADIRSVVEWDSERVTIRPSSELTADEAAAIREVKVTRHTSRNKDGSEVETETREVKLYDKHPSLALLARRHSEFAERVEHSGPDGGPIPVAVLAVLAAMTPAQIAELAQRVGGQAE